ncbi:TonB-dependent copper receptor [Luteimonas mephitis]|uniref:TonB-dependent copper receptor n=1 Tax=Luteimonas mephitis TaxID=83615 RepID=UPI000421C563|nr:TonB-dependent copper receptor [Luteimonas mephitis]
MSIPFSAARRTRPAAALAVLLAVPLAAPAAAPSDADAATTLDRVVVTGVRPRSALTFETDPRLPRQPVPASDGADYLKTIPGFTAIRNGGSNGDPVLRGMFGSRLNLLSNDGSMPGACPARMDNPLSYVSPDTYDRLVVTKGPQTVLWGPGASAGTVRFERDRERFDAPGLQLRGSLLAGSAGRNDQVFDATAGNPLGYLRANGNRSEADDYADGSGARVPSAWRKWNADAAVGWTPDDDTVLELAAGSGDGRARYAGRGMDGAQFRRDSASAHVTRRNAGDVDVLEASLYRNRADHVMDNYTLRDPNPNSPMPMPMASNVERTTIGGRVAATWRGGIADVTAGVDAQDSRHRTRSAMGRGAYRDRPWSSDARLDNVGAFAELTWKAGERQRVVAGARVDRARAEDQRVTTGMMGMANPTAGQVRHETLPGGFVRYEHGAAGAPLGWYAGLGHAQRMPDYWELFSADRGPAGSVNAFSSVAPERTTQLDVGLQYRTRRLDAWVSAYAGRLDDYLLFRYDAGGMMGPMSSVSNVDARIHGAEAGVEWRPSPAWTVGGSLAWAWGENRDSGRPLPQMPPLEGRWSLAWRGEHWSFGSLLRVAARQQRVSIGEGNVVGRDLGPAPGFAVFSVNGGYHFGPRAQLTAGIDNLFDRDYAEHLNLSGSADFGYPADPVRIHEPGRTAWLRLDVSY